MNSSRSRLRLVLSILAGGAFALAACGASAISEGFLEEEAARLAVSEGGAADPAVDCPGDLEAEVGESIECDMTDENFEGVVPVTITVTGTDPPTMDFEVGDVEGGADESTEEEAPVEDEEEPADELPGE